VFGATWFASSVVTGASGFSERLRYMSDVYDELVTDAPVTTSAQLSQIDSANWVIQLVPFRRARLP